MNSLEQVKGWVKEQELMLETELDKTEARIIWQRLHSVKNNLEHYITKRLKNGDYHHFCKECGIIELATFREDIKNKLIEKQLCHHCNLWEEREAEYLSNVKPTLIIDGKMYSDGGATPKGKPTHFNGFAGAEFTIKMLDGSKQWTTNNLWCGGEIPIKYRKTTMSDNAEFIRDAKTIRLV